MAIDRKTAQDLRTIINDALTKALAGRGVTATLGNCRFTDAEAKFDLRVVADADDGSAQTPEMVVFQREAFLYGLKATDLGRTFRNAGATFEVCGLKPSSHRYPVLAKNTANGKVFKFPAETVKALLAA